MKERRRRVVLWSAALALAVASALGCGRSRASRGSAGTDPRDVPVVVKPDSEGLLLTWIDDKGDFHVEMRVADVPMMGRDSVRVVDPGREQDTNAERLFVVDLRQTGADGSYPVRTMTRTEFEAIAVARREKAGPTLAGASPSPAPAGADSAEPHAEAAKPAGRPLVIVYGAEWCGACHDAARYLRRRGIAFVEKDVEKDPTAAREMQQKLAKNGLRAGSIPVIDVRGKVMVGFSPTEVDAALGEGI